LTFNISLVPKNEDLGTHDPGAIALRGRGGTSSSPLPVLLPMSSVAHHSGPISKRPDTVSKCVNGSNPVDGPSESGHPFSPSGKPAPNSPRYFAAIEVLSCTGNRDLLSHAARALAKHWATNPPPIMNMTPNGKSRFPLKTKAIVAMVVFLAVAAFGSGLTDDLQEAGSRYQRDSQTNEPVARDQLIKELNRIRAKASANHEFGIVSLVDRQIEDLEGPKAPLKKQLESDLLYRPAPIAKPVPGKPGFVFSPFGNNKGYIDVRGFPRV
jgi:hypothetical protein